MHLPRGWGRQPSSNLANEAITDPALGSTPAEAAGKWPPPQRYSLRASACEPYRGWITLAVGRRRDAFAIYRDSVDDHGSTENYSNMRRFVPGCARSRPSIPTLIP